MIFHRAEKKQEPKYIVLEVPKDFNLPEPSQDLAISITGLALHPGFQYLMSKLDLLAARLQAQLVGVKHTDLTDVAYLQAGIQWAKWLRAQVEQAKHQLPKQHEATPHELAAAFAPNIPQPYEVVGS